jgi:hypothetical protein
MIRSNILSGEYITNSDEESLKKWFPINGTINENLIAFCVDWGNNHSITSWCGKYDEQKQIIKCHWHLVRQYTDKNQNNKSQLWESFLTGVDIFTFVE